MSGPGHPSDQNVQFWCYFESFLAQAAQVAQINDFGAILSHFWARPPKLTAKIEYFGDIVNPVWARPPK